MLRAELEKVHSDENIFLRQCNKVLWAWEGDRNTSCFHSAATTCETNNTIYDLFNIDVVWWEEDMDIEAIITSYFGQLF